MERRYLVAVVAMSATFLVFSEGFSSGVMTKLLRPQTSLVAEVKCATHALGMKLLEKFGPSLNGRSPEEAQLLAELNLPAALAALKTPELPPLAIAPPVPPIAPVAAVLSDCPEARRAQERAMRAAERAQRQMEQAQERLERSKERMRARYAHSVPKRVDVSFELPENFDQQIQMQVQAMQSRIAAQVMQAQRSSEAFARSQAKISHKPEHMKYATSETQVFVSLP